MCNEECPSACRVFPLINYKESERLKSKTFAALASVLVICLLGVQPVLAVGKPAGRRGPPLLRGEYKIEFKAEATGPFAVLAGLPGPPPPGEPPPIVEIGEGVFKFDGDAAVDQVMDGVYFDFPAEMKSDGEIKGKVSPVEFVDGEMVVSEETWRTELEFWNLDNAGGMFWPDENFFFISYAPPEGEVATCIWYKLEAERLDVEDDDEELKMFGEAYFMVAGVIQMDSDVWYESIIIFLDVAGDPYWILFSEHPEVGSVVEVEVELDVD